MPVPLPKRPSRTIDTMTGASTHDELIESWRRRARARRKDAVRLAQAAESPAGSGWLFYRAQASESRGQARLLYSAIVALRQVQRREQLQPECSRIACNIEAEIPKSLQREVYVVIYPQAVGFCVVVGLYQEGGREAWLREDYRTLEDCETAARLVIAEITAALAACAAVKESEVAA